MKFNRGMTRMNFREVAYIFNHNELTKIWSNLTKILALPRRLLHQVYLELKKPISVKSYFLIKFLKTWVEELTTDFQPSILSWEFKI